VYQKWIFKNYKDWKCEPFMTIFKAPYQTPHYWKLNKPFIFLMFLLWFYFMYMNLVFFFNNKLEVIRHQFCLQSFKSKKKQVGWPKWKITRIIKTGVPTQYNSPNRVLVTQAHLSLSFWQKKKKKTDQTVNIFSF